MNSRSLLTLCLLTAAPSLLLAQPQPPAEPSAPVAPAGVIKPARPAIAPVPARPAVPAEPSELLETPQAPPAPKVAPAAPVAATAPAPPAPPRAPSQMVNVQVEVTLSDSKGPSKTVLLTVADGEMGQNRTATFAASPGSSHVAYTFNADARPVISGNKIRLLLTAEANIPGSGEANDRTPSLNLRQSQTMILNDGASIEIARAADPVSARSFVLTVKATIQR